MKASELIATCFTQAVNWITILIASICIYNCVDRICETKIEIMKLEVTKDESETDP